jgi:hypothetical protein
MESSKGFLTIIALIFLCASTAKADLRPDFLNNNDITLFTAVIKENKVYVRLEPAILSSLKDMHFGLLRDDGSVLELVVEATIPSSNNGIGWVMYKSEDDSSTVQLVSADNHPLTGHFVYMSKEAKNVIKWYPSKVIKAEKDYVDSPSSGTLRIDATKAKEELKQGLVNEKQLTSLFLKDCNIDESHINEITEEQLVGSYYSLLNWHNLFKNITDSADLGLDKNDDYDNYLITYKNNRKILSKVFKTSFDTINNYVPNMGDYKSVFEISYEVDNLQNKLFYSRSVNKKLPEYDVRHMLSAIETIDPTGKRVSILSLFTDREADQSWSGKYDVGEIVGTIEMGDKQNKEVWIVCESPVFESASYIFIQYLPESSINDKRYFELLRPLR